MLKRVIEVSPFQANCWIVACENTAEAVVIDPGDEVGHIFAELEDIEKSLSKKLHVKYILLTHAHVDHVGAAGELKRKIAATGVQAGKQDEGLAKIALNKDDELLYINIKRQADMFGLKCEDPLPIDHYLKDNEELAVGDLRVTVLFTPGHSPGGVCFKINSTVFTGDTLFCGSVGRTDILGGDTKAMFRSIRGRLLSLDDDTLVCPGHGPETTIGEERQQNPFL
ncbi:MAG: MBL fold metallo-hydrolase [Bdellovibrionota bacterium]